MNNKSLKISMVINILIFIMTVLASVIMFTGFKFMKGDPILETTKLEMLKFFTVDSNMFMGIIALIFGIKEFQILKGKKTEITRKMYILKLMATVGVVLTFATVFAYLGPISPGGIPSMLLNSNLFFHFLIPVVSMLNFVIFERSNKIKFRYTIMGVIPMFIYAIFYLSNVLVHMDNGKVAPVYDWYWFVQGGVWQLFIVLPLMIIVTYIISLILWRLNKKVKD